MTGQQVSLATLRELADDDLLDLVETGDFLALLEAVEAAHEWFALNRDDDLDPNCACEWCAPTNRRLRGALARFDFGDHPTFLGPR